MLIVAFWILGYTLVVVDIVVVVVVVVVVLVFDIHTWYLTDETQNVTTEANLLVALKSQNVAFSISL